MLSTYDFLIKNTEIERDALLSNLFIQHGLSGDLSKQSYLAFLEQAYHHVKHTVPLLMACGSRIPFEKEWLRDAMAEYIEEELGHQEWILSDIRNCGGDADQVRDAQPSTSTEMMVAYAYYMIERINPIGFLGMVLVLEGTSIRAASAAAEALSKRLNLGNDCFTYLSSHGALDLSHMNFYEGLVNRITDVSEQHILLHSAQRFYRLYNDIFTSLPLTLNKEIVT